MKKFSFLFLVVLVSKVAVAQGGSFATDPKLLTKMSEVLPQAPNAASIARYGGVDIDLNTGAVKKVISLKTIEARDIKIPVALMYNSMGIRVNNYPARVGMGWNFLAGGMISRVIRGADDLVATRYVPSFNIQGVDYNTNTYCWRLKNEGNRDSEPDIFSFNFDNYSGKFFFDNQGNIVQVPVSNLKIEYNISTYTDNTWNFRITTPNGYKYFFGGPNAKEESKNGSSLKFNAYIPNGWHLNRIVHHSGYIVNFLYETNSFGPYLADIEQTHFNGSPTNGSGCGTVEFDQGLFYVYIDSRVSLLKEINTNMGNKVIFNYSSQGYPEKILTSIDYVDEKSLSYLKYSFEYYMIQSIGGPILPFLQRVKGFSGQSNLIHTGHEFTYYNTNEIPKPFSFSQDHWGFYNGKPNSTLIPQPSDPSIAAQFPNATGNRNPDPAKAVNGLLFTIKYPTGGKDEIIYEPNMYSTQVVGGMRVKKIITYDNTAGNQMVKRFYYGTLANRDVSSAQPVVKPRYDTPFTLTIFAFNGSCQMVCNVDLYFNALHYSALNKIHLYDDGKFIQYSSVIESLGGDNYENGAVEHKFHIVQDYAPQVITGWAETVFSPFTNGSHLSQGEIETNTYAKKSGALIKRVSKKRK